MAVIVPYTSEVETGRVYPPKDTSQFFKNTCEECPSRGLLDVVGDYVVVGSNEEPKLLVVGFPDRCKPCGANHKRFGRAKTAIRKVATVAIAEDERPKLVTIGLPSEWIELNTRNISGLDSPLRCESDPKCSDSQEDENPITIQQLRELFISVRESEMKLLKRRYREAKPTIINRFGVHGGHDFFECTWKVRTADNNYSYTTAEPSHNSSYLHVREPITEDEFGPVTWTDGEWKIEDVVAIKVHAHVHGVWASPFIDQDGLNEYLLQMNLGRADIRSKAWNPVDPEDWISKHSGYLSKYLSKENRFRSSPWGICRAPFAEPGN